jgi:hypothetical protein
MRGRRPYRGVPKAAALAKRRERSRLRRATDPAAFYLARHRWKLDRKLELAASKIERMPVDQLLLSIAKASAAFISSSEWVF